MSDTSSKGVDTASTITGANGADKDEKGGKGFANAEDRLSDSVKGVVKHLGTTENVTLDDLNSARQAVAKIEALIDIEKRLNELEKLRSEREGKSLMGAIPASALTAFPPPQNQSQFQAPPSLPMPASVIQNPMLSANNLEVSRIVGSATHASAFIKMPDGQTKTVQVGDHLPEGTVVAITAAGVQLEQNNGTRHIVRVKNVDTVFGNSP